MIEKWLPVVGYEGLYEVSNWGRVRSLARMGTYSRILTPIFIKKKRYLKVTLHDSGQKTNPIHQLVAEAFIGPCPEGKEIDHRDKNGTNNFSNNLRYVTYARHVQRHLAKLTSQQVLEIRRLYKEGFSQTQLARQFEVSQQQISRIINYERWENIL